MLRVATWLPALVRSAPEATAHRLLNMTPSGSKAWPPDLHDPARKGEGWVLGTGLCVALAPGRVRVMVVRPRLSGCDRGCMPPIP